MIYLRTIFAPIACKEARLFGVDSCSCPPASAFYKLLEIERPGMALWGEKLFALMAWNEHSATDFFRLPPARVLELGAQVEL